jgi:hypothetical protein
MCSSGSTQHNVIRPRPHTVVGCAGGGRARATVRAGRALYRYLAAVCLNLNLMVSQCGTGLAGQDNPGPRAAGLDSKRRVNPSAVIARRILPASLCADKQQSTHDPGRTLVVECEQPGGACRP